jgi:hypothetical protein
LDHAGPECDAHHSIVGVLIRTEEYLITIKQKGTRNRRVRSLALARAAFTVEVEENPARVNS